MINTEPIEKILKVALASGRLKDDRPLSLILIGHPEAGKTSILRKYCIKTENILYASDITAYGVIQATNQLRDFASGKISHLVIPDFLACLGRKPFTVRTLIHFMSALVEEGVVNISTYATNVKAGDIEVKAGLITAIPPVAFFDKRRHWERIGFLSRALPVSFDYKRSTVARILNYIENQEHLTESIERLELPRKQQTIELPIDIAKSIEPYAVSLAAEHSKYQKIYGFRYQRQLQTFVKALAMLEGKKKVDIECIRELERLLEYINFDFNKI